MKRVPVVGHHYAQTNANNVK